MPCDLTTARCVSLLLLLLVCWVRCGISELLFETYHWLIIDEAKYMFCVPGCFSEPSAQNFLSSSIKAGPGHYLGQVWFILEICH